jgi:hypothetical protein
MGRELLRSYGDKDAKFGLNKGVRVPLTENPPFTSLIPANGVTSHPMSSRDAKQQSAAFQRPANRWIFCTDAVDFCFQVSV